jgi:hypothetical protein
VRRQLLVLILLGFYGGAKVHGAVQSPNVRVIVPLQDLLKVTNGGTIVLDSTQINLTLSDTIGPVSDATAQLNYPQNSPKLKKITAQATSNPSGHDITLTVDVAGGNGPKNLIQEGITQAVESVYINVPAGALYDRIVKYTAQCTARGTRLVAPADFVFTITFTSSDN